MEEKKKNGHGGVRKGAGRKPKADEIKLIEQLSVYDAVAMRELKKGVRNGSYKHLELFLSYRWGKPTAHTDITTNGKDFSMPIIEFFSNEEDDTDEEINE